MPIAIHRLVDHLRGATEGERIERALVIVIVAFSLIPIVIEWWRHRRTDAPGAEIGKHDGGPDRDITGRDLD